MELFRPSFVYKSEMRQNPANDEQPALPFDGPTAPSNRSDPSDRSDPPAPEEPLLDDARWDLIKGCFPAAQPRRRRRGRKGGRPSLPARLGFEALLWHLAGGRPWAGLPKRFGSARTVQRRLDRWLEGGSLRAAWRRYLETAPDRTPPDWRSRPGKKRGLWYWEMLGAARAFSGGRAGQPQPIVRIPVFGIIRYYDK